MDNRIRRYKHGDLASIWADLPDADRREMADSALYEAASLEPALIKNCPKLHTWDTECGPVAVFGVTGDMSEGAGLVWALVTNAAHRRWRYGVRITGPLLDYLGEGYAALYNYKDSRNTKQIAWLKKLGFTFIAQRRLGDAVWLEFVRITK